MVAEGLRFQDWLWVVTLCSGLQVPSVPAPAVPSRSPPPICLGPPYCVGEGKKGGSWCPPSLGLPYLSDQPLPFSFLLCVPALAVGPHALPLVSGRSSLSTLLVWVFVGEGVACTQLTLWN